MHVSDSSIKLCPALEPQWGAEAHELTSGSLSLSQSRVCLRFQTQDSSDMRLFRAQRIELGEDSSDIAKNPGEESSHMKDFDKIVKI